MAHISTPPIGSPRDLPPSIRKPGADERRTALAVLLTGRPTPGDPAVEHFLNFAHQQGLSTDGLWALYDNQTPICSSLIIPGVGRTAVLFTSPIHRTQHVQPTADLVQAVVSSQDPAEVRLIQSLLEPTQKHLEQALSLTDFTRLASLVYMRRSALHPAGPTAAGQGAGKDGGATDIRCDGKALKIYQWRDDRHDLFARAIDTSYRDTLDCPGLVGVRDMDDIIAGHRAVGRFEPGLWSAYYLDNQPAAVLLLNPLIDRTELELVYLGLAPAFRGKGLATQIMDHAFAQAAQRNDTGIHLAVDQDNAPAVRLYQRLGFRATGRKLAMICVLK